MKKYYWLLSLVIISVFFFQCHKGLSYIGSPDNGGTVSPDPITSSVQGDVTDENGLPAMGVSITCDSNTTVTDSNGYFRFSNIALDQNTSLVTAVKNGYFTAYRVFAATSGCNQVAIKLVTKNLAGTVSAASGGVVTLTNGAIVSLPANGIVIASSNAAYTGTVNVYANYIDPTASDIAKTVPGSFVANDVNGNRVLLSSFGMLAVELQSTSGQILQIKSGNVAALTFPIPSASLSSAPASIAMWYVNETTGIWQQEGTATRQGNNYSGTVKHFTYWNCDDPNQSVMASFTLETPNGSPVVNAWIELIPASGGGVAHGYTDSLGQVRGLIPANQNLTLEVLGPCGFATYSQTIPAISTPTDLGIFKIDIPQQYLLTFTGTITDCSGMSVTKGEAFINFNGTTRYTSTNAQGQFTTNFIVCSNPPSISVIGIDNTAQQQGYLQTIAVTLPVTNEPNLVACGASFSEYINYTLDGVNYILTSNNSNSSIYGTTESLKTTLTGFPGPFVTGSGKVDLYTYASTTGSFEVDTIVYINNYDQITAIEPFDITFTSFPAIVGDYYEGSFSGSFFSDTLQTVSHTISATFRIRRNQ